MHGCSTGANTGKDCWKVLFWGQCDPCKILQLLSFCTWSVPFRSCCTLFICWYTAQGRDWPIPWMCTRRTLCWFPRLQLQVTSTWTWYVNWKTGIFQSTMNYPWLIFFHATTLWTFHGCVSKNFLLALCLLSASQQLEWVFLLLLGMRKQKLRTQIL